MISKQRNDSTCNDSSSVSVSLDKDSTPVTPRLFLPVFSAELITGALIGSPKVVSDKFGRVFDAAARRVVNNSRKYDRGLTYARRHGIPWLDISERIQFRIVVTVHRIAV